MTRQDERKYADWYSVYIEEVRDRVKHWGDKRKSAISPNAASEANPTDLDNALFASGR